MILLTRIVACALIFVCGIEALYWPLLPKPGTIYAWWQIGALAHAGWYLAFVPFWLTLWIGQFTPLQVEIGWLSNVAWAAAIFLLSGKVRWRRQKATQLRT